MPYTEFHYTPTGTGVISGKEVLEQTEDAINDLGGQISGDVQTAIDTANNALNTANTASADAQNAVNTANTAYTAATNAQNTANTAQTTASNALTAAQNAQNDVNALGNRVTTAENNISQNTTDISGLTTRMGTAEGNITNLQNDVITAQGSATSAQNTATLARGQAYVTRYTATSVSDNSTVAYSDLNNTDNIKIGDFILDVNGKLYAITAVDGVNETVSVTTPLTKLAVDSSVMHLSGNETVSGNKTFSDGIGLNSWLYFTNTTITKGTIPQSTVTPYRIYFGSGINYANSLFNIDTSVSNTGVQSFIFRSAENVVSGDDARFVLIYDPNRTQPRYLSVKGGIEPNANHTYDCGSGTNIWKDLYCYHGYFRGQQQGDEYSGNARTNLTLLANRDTAGQSGCLVDTFRSNTTQGTGSHILGFGMKENSVRYEGVRLQWIWNSSDSGYDFNLKPTTQGTNKPVTYNLGTSDDKWDTINGLNPGALSLPDLNNGIDISGYFDATQISTNTYTALADGYISLAISSPNRGSINAVVGSDFWGTTSYGAVNPNDNNSYLQCMFMPILKSQTITVYLRTTGGTLESAKFFPCLGNV